MSSSYGSISSPYDYSSDSDRAPLNASPDEYKPYKLYARRWLMLLMFSSVGLMNNAMWIFFAPFPITASKYYEVPSIFIDYLSATFMVMTLFLTLPCAWLCDSKGTRICTILGCFGTFLCGWIRWFSYFSDDGPTKYWIVFTGQMIGALGQPFLLPPPPKLATSWFAADERVIATGAGALCVVGGIATGYGMGMIVTSPDRIDTLLLVQAILGTVTCVPTALLYREQPPSPPTPSAADALPPIPFWDTVKMAFREWRFLIVLFSLGPGYGAIAALFSVLGDMATLPAVGYSQYEAGWFGVIMILVGLVGAAVIGTVCFFIYLLLFIYYLFIVFFFFFFFNFLNNFFFFFKLFFF